MYITAEAETLLDSDSRRKDMAPLLDITVVTLCASSNLENTPRHARKKTADAVERNNRKCRGSFPATNSLISLAMLTCREVGSDVHAFIKKLVIRRIERSSVIHSNESHHLAEGT